MSGLQKRQRPGGNRGAEITLCKGSQHAENITEMELAKASTAGVLDFFLLMVGAYKPQGGELELPDSFYPWLDQYRQGKPPQPPAARGHLLDCLNQASFVGTSQVLHLFTSRTLLRNELACLRLALDSLSTANAQQSTATVLCEVEAVKLFLLAIHGAMGLVLAEDIAESIH